ncbi:TetR/AcrR family transcriptional regulator [Agromyces larvae]|uniref:TetR/AcrR family transcriptional regulator n=1 Tax=Agromyces larvae TaxID=2929802 RepID=A0ABY4BVQ6_9MICO|nr:TetR/AcrR family transcriptional regulator [Agromyces larvae]UOE43295.1 TetR/AcrR family transcriptional regulator [Agromyces larvae]
MATSERMARRREQRRLAILAAAREFAETEGWQAVTSRRLADAIDYTQPVIYSHFDSMDAVIDAVAVEGFAELARALADARSEASDDRGALEAASRAYLGYADAHPAMYDAMFVRGTALAFADERTEPELRAGFAELRGAVEPFADDPDTLAELLWASLHGLTLLQRSQRIPGDRDVRLRALLALIAGADSAR